MDIKIISGVALAGLLGAAYFAGKKPARKRPPVKRNRPVKKEPLKNPPPKKGGIENLGEAASKIGTFLKKESTRLTEEQKQFITQTALTGLTFLLRRWRNFQAQQDPNIGGENLQGDREQINNLDIPEENRNELLQDLNNIQERIEEEKEPQTMPKQPFISRFEYITPTERDKTLTELIQKMIGDIEKNRNELTVINEEERTVMNTFNDVLTDEDLNTRVEEGIEIIRALNEISVGSRVIENATRVFREIHKYAKKNKFFEGLAEKIAKARYTLENRGYRLGSIEESPFYDIGRLEISGTPMLLDNAPAYEFLRNADLGEINRINPRYLIDLLDAGVYMVNDTETFRNYFLGILTRYIEKYKNEPSEMPLWVNALGTFLSDPTVENLLRVQKYISEFLQENERKLKKVTINEPISNYFKILAEFMFLALFYARNTSSKGTKNTRLNMVRIDWDTLVKKFGLFSSHRITFYEESPLDVTPDNILNLIAYLKGVLEKAEQYADANSYADLIRNKLKIIMSKIPTTNDNYEWKKQLEEKIDNFKPAPPHLLMKEQSIDYKELEQWMKFAQKVIDKK